MADYTEKIQKYAETVADATIAELKETLERDWRQLPYPSISQGNFLNRVMSCAISEISSAEGTQLKGSEILDVIRQKGKISAPGIVSDHAKYKLKIWEMVVYIYRKKRMVRLRVGDPWPARAFSNVYDVECENPKGCSAEVCVSVIEAFRDSYEQICIEYSRVVDFYDQRIYPRIKRLLEIETITRSALQK